MMVMVMTYRDNDGDGDSNTGGDGGTVTAPANTYKYALTAWNDLGMHCMDGNDFQMHNYLQQINS